MKKLFAALVIVLTLTSLTSCGNVFSKHREVTYESAICSLDFETLDDYEWFAENIFENDEYTDEQKDQIYYKMTNTHLYVKRGES